MNHAIKDNTYGERVRTYVDLDYSIAWKYLKAFN